MRGKRESVKKKDLKKSFRILFFSTIILLFILILTVFIFLFENNSDFSDSKITQMSSLVKKVRKLEDNIQTNQNDILTLVEEYKEKTGKNLPTLDIMNLSEEERLLLEEKINSESNISIKNLLAEILNKKSEILELNMHIRNIEKFLPKPHIVSDGENHYQIAMDYLLNIKGVEKREALELVEKTFMFEPIIPGFKIWNFFSGGEFGSFVSQGTASVSPNEVNRRAKRKLTDARDEAIVERDIMADDVKFLRKKRDDILRQISALNSEKIHLLRKIEELNIENASIVKKINSLHYIIDTRSNLVKGGILKGGFLRSLKLQAVSHELFSRSIDLRSDSIIILESEDLKINKIKKITIFPKFYKKNVDYKISFMKNKKHAEFTILNLDKLKNERIVISVE